MSFLPVNRDAVRCLTLAALMFAALSSDCLAWQPARTNHESVRRFLGRDTAFVGWVDLTQLDVSSLQDFASAAGLDSLPKMPRRVRETQQGLVELGVTRVYCVSSLADMLTGPRAILVPASQDQIERVSLLLNAAAGDEQTVLAEGDVLLVGEDSAVRSLQAADGNADRNLLAVLAQSSSPNGVVMGTSQETLRTVSGLLSGQMSQLPQLRDELERLLPGLQGIALHGQLPPEQATLQIHMDSAESANELTAALNSQLAATLQEAAGPLHLSAGDSVVSLQKDSLESSVEALRSVLQLLQPARDAAYRRTVMNSLKQLGLGMHNFHDLHGRFPPQKLVDGEGTPMLSWRVLILPFLDQKDLYDQFRLNEPWDSEHNLRLATQMPDVFRSPDDSAELTAAGRTRFVGPLTDQSMLGRPGDSVQIREIIDGTSNTIMVVQTTADQAVIWTKPADLVIRDDRPVFEQIAGGAELLAAGMCDGAALYLNRTFPEQIMRAVLSIDGRELFEWPER